MEGRSRVWKCHAEELHTTPWQALENHSQFPPGKPWTGEYSRCVAVVMWIEWIEEGQWACRWLRVQAGNVEGLGWLYFLFWVREYKKRRNRFGRSNLFFDVLKLGIGYISVYPNGTMEEMDLELRESFLSQSYSFGDISTYIVVKMSVWKE